MKSPEAAFNFWLPPHKKTSSSLHLGVDAAAAASALAQAEGILALAAAVGAPGGGAAASSSAAGWDPGQLAAALTAAGLA